MIADDPEALDRSYRALFQVRSIGRVLAAMQIARVAQSMVSVAIVLFTLAEYRSPVLAGVVTFASIFPGLIVAPIAGALLDRHGRVRLIIVDWLVEMGALVLIGVLALAHSLPAPLLIVITAIASLTGILSHTGLRSLFPLIVPSHLWERANAIDSNGYVVATILGPPMAASIVAIAGGPAALIVVGVAFGLAAVAIVGAPDPANETATSGRLLRDALDGLAYTWRNPTLRGLGFAMATVNLAGGMTTIVVPLLVLERVGAGAGVVGMMFAVSGVAGMISTLLWGRVDSRGREWSMLVIPMALVGPALALLLFAPTATPGIVIALIATSMALFGLLEGPVDIALFTVRQRRTDPAWMGRAFAVSMAFNFLGFPIGAAIAGALATVSIEAAISVGVVAALVAAILAATMVPRTEPVS